MLPDKNVKSHLPPPPPPPVESSIHPILLVLSKIPGAVSGNKRGIVF